MYESNIEARSRNHRYRAKATATCYGLVGPWIESRWRRHFPHPPGWPWGPPILLYNWYRVFFGGKAAGEWGWPSMPSTAQVFTDCCSVTFTFTLHLTYRY